VPVIPTLETKAVDLLDVLDAMVEQRDAEADRLSVDSLVPPEIVDMLQDEAALLSALAETVRDLLGEVRGYRALLTGRK
jgi:hypothetical protein